MDLTVFSKKVIAMLSTGVEARGSCLLVFRHQGDESQAAGVPLTLLRWPHAASAHNRHARMDYEISGVTFCSPANAQRRKRVGENQRGETVLLLCGRPGSLATRWRQGSDWCRGWVAHTRGPIRPWLYRCREVSSLRGSPESVAHPGGYLRVWMSSAPRPVLPIALVAMRRAFERSGVRPMPRSARAALAARELRFGPLEHLRIAVTGLGDGRGAARREGGRDSVAHGGDGLPFVVH